MKYIAIDGDDVGRTLTKIIYESKSELDIIEYSNSIVKSFREVKKWVENKRGLVLFCTGDSILYKLNNKEVKESLKVFESAFFNVSVGIGKSAKEAHWALNIAKSLGKNQVILFEDIRDELFGK